MNDQDITVIITSFHSGEKIFNCIESINKDVKIIVVENSNDQELKEKIQNLILILFVLIEIHMYGERLLLFVNSEQRN